MILAKLVYIITISGLFSLVLFAKDMMGQLIIPYDLDKLSVIVSDKAESDEEITMDIAKYYKDQGKLNDAINLLVGLKGKHHKLSNKFYSLLGGLYLDVGKQGSSVEILQEGELRYPSDGAIIEQLGYAYEKAFDSENARKYFEKSIKRNPGNYKLYLKLSILEFKDNNFSQSRHYLNKTLNLISLLVKEGKNSPRLVYDLGIGYVLAGEWKEVEKTIAVLKEQDTLLSHDLEGRLLTFKKQIRGELEFVEKASLRKPENLKVNKTLAHMYTYVGEHETALKVLLKLNKIYSENVDVNSHIAMIYFQKQDYEEALGYLEKAAKNVDKHSSRYVSIMADLGHAYLHLSKNKEAIDMFTKSINMSKKVEHVSLLDVAYARYGRGIARLKVERELEIRFLARPSYYRYYYFSPLDKVVEKSPKEFRYSRIVKEFEAAILEKYDLVEAYYALGVTFQALNDFKKAIISFHEAIRYKPNYTEALIGLSYSYFFVGELKNAIKHMRKALYYEPKSEKVLRAIAEFYMKLGKQDEALSYYRKLLEINPSYGEAYYESGVLYASLGKWKEASGFLQKLKKIDANLAKKLSIYIQETRSGKY